MQKVTAFVGGAQRGYFRDGQNLVSLLVAVLVMSSVVALWPLSSWFAPPTRQVVNVSVSPSSFTPEFHTNMTEQWLERSSTTSAAVGVPPEHQNMTERMQELRGAVPTDAGDSAPEPYRYEHSRLSALCQAATAAMEDSSISIQ